MRLTFDDTKPIFQQIAEMIEDDIVNGVLKNGDQIPSTNQLVAHYKINPATILKGFNQLVDSGLVYKKRGVGMFVADGAFEMIRERRISQFQQQFVEPLIMEAKKLGMTKEEIQKMFDSYER